MSKTRTPDGRTIPGYGEKYRVLRDGRIFRLTPRGEYVPLATWGDPARVTLIRLGERFQPQVRSIVRRVYMRT